MLAWLAEVPGLNVLYSTAKCSLAGEETRLDKRIPISSSVVTSLVEIELANYESPAPCPAFGAICPK